jgi:hypothetical protein
MRDVIYCYLGAIWNNSFACLYNCLSAMPPFRNVSKTHSDITIWYNIFLWLKGIEMSSLQWRKINTENFVLQKMRFELWFVLGHFSSHGTKNRAEMCCFLIVFRVSPILELRIKLCEVLCSYALTIFWDQRSRRFICNKNEINTENYILQTNHSIISGGIGLPEAARLKVGTNLLVFLPHFSN